jgi:hypothetical protein
MREHLGVVALRDLAGERRIALSRAAWAFFDVTISG